MKFILLLLSFFSLGLISHSQDNTFLQQMLFDTARRTTIEKVLKKTNVVQKVEYVAGNSVGGTYFSILLVRDLQTRALTKGIYVSSAPSPSTYSLNSKRVPHAYIDEHEVEGLVSFFEQCDAVWKKETPEHRTSYEFETSDNLRFTFSAGDLSNNWRFAIQYGDYYLFNPDTMGKGKSSTLYSVLKDLQQVMDQIKD